MNPSPPVIRTLRTVSELRAAIGVARSARSRGAACETEGPEAEASNLIVGLVPTMGALHEGHLSLIRHARRHCDLVVVSLFVNPTQFNEPSDLKRYPRQEERDALLAEQAGAELLFAPSVKEIYPQGFRTSVEVTGITEPLEGASRGAEHFKGVTTVVSKLLNIVGPDVAYFGQKDAQQVLVIKRMVEDLNMPVEIEVCPTVREHDGLARSSRNELLDPPERAKARALYAGLNAASERVSAGERSATALLESARETMLDFEVEPEYLELVDPQTLEPLQTLDRDALLLVAAPIGAVRLIDNITLSPLPAGAGPQSGESPQSSGDHGRQHSSASPKSSRKARSICSA